MEKTMLLPFLGAFFGWCLYQGSLILSLYPKEPLKIGNWRFQGILPKFQNRVLDKLIDTVCKDLNPKEFEGLFDQLDFEKDLDFQVDKRIDSFIENIKQQIPLAGMFLKDSLIKQLKDLAKEEFYKMIPEIKQTLSKSLTHLDFQERLKNKISSSYDKNNIDRFLSQTLTKESRTLGYFAIGTGFLFGLLEVIFVTFPER